MDKEDALIKAVDITISAITVSENNIAITHPKLVDDMLRQTYKTLCDLSNDAKAEYVSTFN